MAGRIAYYGNIVTNGLVLNLDAAKKDSYPGSGTTWRDISGNRNNGTLTNGPTFNSDNGGSIVFDGSNDYGDLGTFTGLGATNRTISIWFKIISLSLSGNRRVISLVTDDTVTDTPAFTIGYSTTLSSLSIGFGGNPYNGYILNIPFTLNTWINLCGSINSNNMNVYVNGAFIGNVTNTGAVGANPIMYLGRYNNHYGQNGNVNISQVQIYNRALSATEIAQNYNALKGRYGL
jgi:hypothetical protein